MIVAEVGNWTVKKITDDFSSQTTCRGSYKHNTRTYLSMDQLSLFTTDEYTMESVIIRYGDDPPKLARKATALETRLGTVFLKGKEFLELMKHNRVRTRVILFRSTTDEDVDLTGIQDAVMIMKNGCKV